MIEFDGRVGEIVQAIGDEHGDQSAGRAGKRSGCQPDQPQCGGHGQLCQKVVSKIVANHAINDFHQPPGQRRQFVIAELPFPAVGEGFDKIERQIGVKQRGKGGPHHNLKDQKCC
jgi:hypothetical protein